MRCGFAKCFHTPGAGWELSGKAELPWDERVCSTELCSWGWDTRAAFALGVCGV